VYGRRVSAETRLADGDRVEIYRELLIDPKERRRQRAAKRRR
jgi:putative ubiquitin-RnfH superfamily antitoxin RatB of RatAB toxin-antitoxin module